MSTGPFPNVPRGIKSPPLLPPSAPSLYTGRHLGAIAARWDTKAPTWDREVADPSCHLNEDNAYRRFLAAIRDLIRHRADFCQRHGVIDAGCGTGLVLAEVAASFRWGIGVDLSEQMIHLAAGKSIPSASFIVGDCFNLAAICPRAGAVISRGVLISHYGRRLGQGILRSAYAALAPGGFLAFDFLNETARSHYHHSPDNKTYYTRADACSLAEKAGLRSPIVVGEEQRRVLLLVAQVSTR